MGAATVHKFEVATTANEATRQAWAGLDKGRLREDLKQGGLTVSERQLERYQAPISETETGQMSPLGKADQIITATQKQSRSRALDLIAWLSINFIRRDRREAGRVQVIWLLRTFFTELEVRVVTLLAEEERQEGN